MVGNPGQDLGQEVGARIQPVLQPRGRRRDLTEERQSDHGHPTERGHLLVHRAPELIEQGHVTQHGTEQRIGRTVRSRLLAVFTC
jgi:hypothetical protein